MGQAFVVGLCTFGASYIAGALLIFFYYSSSKLTKMGAAKKQKIDAEYSEGGQRGYVQVGAGDDVVLFWCKGAAALMRCSLQLTVGACLLGSGDCDCLVHCFPIRPAHSVADRFC